ncbi:glycosyl transferase family 2 [Clostridium sartagoforme AAU1]|uniref:Glycosyl transferase family 2 n=1 Tax=Clostridium sartagoforme AAU1 TaxID=1202534 RepID=R9CM54_9CLOT|nr:glycosyltransferase family 2 protein [Clostridium sartagoforme]EOR28271.1 glycosyl transferase family 2 [Clostridium sartagoforme AAU1]
MNKIDISIITVCFNSEKTIEKCIKSVVNQLDLNIEYIIVDGQSTDGTINIIKKYREKFPIKFISEKDNGIYDAMNKGIELAEGEWIIFINSDDWLEDRLLSRINKELKEQVEDSFYGNIRKVDEEGNMINISKPTYNISEIIKKGMPVFHQAIFIKRKVYSELGGFDISFKIAGDWDFICRMYGAGYTFKYSDVIISNFTVGGTSSKRHIMEKHRVRKKNKTYRFLDFYIIKELMVDYKRKLFGRKHKEQ